MGTKKNNLGVRIAMAVIGIALTAVSVGLQKISGLGVDPFSVIIFGFSNAFHATYQTVYIVVCAVLLSIAFVFNRNYLELQRLSICFSADLLQMPPEKQL